MCLYGERLDNLSVREWPYLSVMSCQRGAPVTSVTSLPFPSQTPQPQMHMHVYNMPHLIHMYMYVCMTLRMRAVL